MTKVNSRGDIADASPEEAASAMDFARSPRFLAAIGTILALIAVGMIHFIPTIAKLGSLAHGGGSLLGRFLVAVALIIVVSSLGGLAAVRCRQPRVVGEMLAGIGLGPSLLGHIAPAGERWLFPAVVSSNLNLIAELAVIAFVFLFGAELPLKLLRGSGRRVIVLGISMVAIPVACGILLAAGLSGSYRPQGIRPVSFLLFVGVATGVTAFPVLVRILTELGLTRLRVGALALAAAGVDDAVAWCLLAVAVGTVHSGSAAGALKTVALLIVFAAGVWVVLRPALRQLLAFGATSAGARAASVVVLLATALCGAFITDWIGVHAIFGAFLVGVILPRENAVVRDLTRVTQGGVRIVLPLFFAAIGLQVRLDLLSAPRELLVCGLVIVVAVVTKVGATALIARPTGLTWRESAGLGIMVNCRGLTALVVLTTGESLGIIGQDLFVIFVVMTLVTTMMTGPLLRRLALDRSSPAAEPVQRTPDPPAPRRPTPGRPGTGPVTSG